MFRIGIVIPKFNNQIQKRYNFPVGLAYISSALKANRYPVEGLNLNNVKSSDLDKTLKQWILDKKINVIMTGGLSADYSRIKDIFKISKECNKEIITIGGGGGYSSEPILFSEMTDVDFACIGEGEITVCELMDAITNNKDLSKVDGIVWKTDNGSYRMNNERSYIENLDTINFPDYDDFEMDKYLLEQTPYDYYYTYTHDEPRMYPIYLGRSCPYNCNFCYHPLGNKYRQRTLDNFFLELDAALKKYKINSLGIFDELFSLKPDNIYNFCKRIKPYNLKWHIQLRVNLVDRNLLECMKDAGCSSISYGIESVNAKVLKNMNKKISKEQIEKALALTYSVGICIQGNFIFGDEQETLDSVSETLNWWRKNRKYQLNLGFIETYPGTQLYKNAISNGLIKDRRKFIELNCPIINMTKLSDDEFWKIKTIIGLEEYCKCDEVSGEVISITKDENDDNFVSVTLRCPICKEISTYNRIEVMRVYSNHFKISCRSCNRKNIFDTREYLNIRDSEYKYKMYFYLLREWETTKLASSSMLSKNLINCNKSSVLYDNEFGEYFLNQLNGRFDIASVIDEEITSRYKPLNFNGEVIGMEDLSNNNIDNIIIMNVFDFQEKSKMLRELGYDGKITSLVDLVLNI